MIIAILDRSALFGEGGHIEEILKVIALTVSEFASIKPEQILEMAEMECLLAQWEALGSPFSSLHDTPFFVELSVQELEKRLRL